MDYFVRYFNKLILIKDACYASANIQVPHFVVHTRWFKCRGNAFFGFMFSTFPLKLITIKRIPHEHMLHIAYMLISRNTKYSLHL